MAISSRQTSPDLGLLILRLGTGFLMLLHGIAKLQLALPACSIQSNFTDEEIRNASIEIAKSTNH